MLQKEGWKELRQKGSHVIMVNDKSGKKITVPYHSGKEVKKGLLERILKETSIKHKK